jgi:hypothetical protein
VKTVQYILNAAADLNSSLSDLKSFATLCVCESQVVALNIRKRFK